MLGIVASWRAMYEFLLQQQVPEQPPFRSSLHRPGAAIAAERDLHPKRRDTDGGDGPGADSMVEYGKVRLREGMVWYGMVWYGMVWYGMVWYGMVWYGMVWYGMVWYGMVWYGMVWYGMVWYGMVWYGMVWYGMVWYCRVK